MHIFLVYVLIHILIVIHDANKDILHKTLIKRLSHCKVIIKQDNQSKNLKKTGIWLAVWWLKATPGENQAFDLVNTSIWCFYMLECITEER